MKRKFILREEAEERQKERDRRSDLQQIELLKLRGYGKCKEVKRLRKCIKKEEGK